MSEHDPMCTHHATPYVCDCNFIARVRADERERLWARVPQLPLWGTGLVRVSDVLALIDEAAP